MLQLQLLERRIFYFLKTTVNGETNDNRLMKYLVNMVNALRFHISIQLIFVQWFAMQSNVVMQKNRSMSIN